MRVPHVDRSTRCARGMGHIVDVVANHMGIARSANPWWQDLLDNGPSSWHADTFDIDWRPLKRELECKVLLPVLYRTFVNERELDVSERDRAYLEAAVREAKRRDPTRPSSVYHFIRDLLLKRADYIPESERDEQLQFVGKFQQVTSPVTAKGIEDTALYMYNRLVSLNEVGGEPDRFGVVPGELHAWLAAHAARWPHSLSATSTHNTKRSEDVRARINVLSELMSAWRQVTSRWARINRRFRSVVDGQSYPSPNEEYLLYQALVGTWPLEPMDEAAERAYRDRLTAYMQKAMREAKVFTSWINPSEEHERAMARFVEGVLSPDHESFRRDFVPFAARVARYGLYNSLAQLAIKAAAPGVFAFARSRGEQHVIVAVPRPVATLAPDPDVPPLGETVWDDTDLAVPDGTACYRQVFTDQPVPVERRDGRPFVRAADAFTDFPIAVLEKSEGV